MSRDFNVLALLKGEEVYVYVYDDASRPALDAVFRDQAANPDLGFSWFDAAVLNRKAQEQGQSAAVATARL